MLPFMLDQLMMTGASSDELSAVVYWFYWVKTVIQGLGMVSVWRVIINTVIRYIDDQLLWKMLLSLYFS